MILQQDTRTHVLDPLFIVMGILDYPIPWP